MGSKIKKKAKPEELLEDLPEDELPGTYQRSYRKDLLEDFQQFSSLWFPTWNTLDLSTAPNISIYVRILVQICL